MATKKTTKKDTGSDENLIIQLINRYVVYWILFLGLVLMAGAGAFVYVRYATPKYEAAAKIIIKDEKKGAEDSKALESFNIISTKKIIENEVEVLQSNKIMDRVIRRLHLYAVIKQKGKIRDVSAFNISPVTILSANPDSITPVHNVPLEYNVNQQVVTLNKNIRMPLNTWVNTPYGQLQCIPNPRYRPSKDNKPFYFSLYTLKDLTKTLLRDLKVSPSSKLATVINLHFQDENPDRAELILNEVIHQYDTASIEVKNLLAQNTLNFINQRLSIVAKDLDSIEKNVQRFKSGSQSANISAQGQLYLQNVSSNDQQIGKINSELAVLDQVNRSLSATGNGQSGTIASTMGLSDPNLSKLITDLNSKELEYERQSKTVAENNPSMTALRDQIGMMKSTIQSSLISQRNNLEATRSNLSSSNSRFNSILSNIPQKERAILEISRDQNVKNGIYAFLLQKKEESELSLSSALSDSRVVNEAVSSKSPVSPNKMFIYLGAISAAIFLGIIFITIRESLHRNILYRKDLESLTAIPVISELSLTGKTASKLIEPGKRSLLAEEFRKIRVALHYLGIDKSKRKILVTSSLSGEGKSFLAANLAISNALAGKKVVLIDADLHKPGLSELFGKQTQDTGLSDYLSDQASIETVLQPIDGYKNLHLISSGFLHEAPSELLLNEKMEQLINQLDGQFDLIIVDSAPTQLITDAYVLTSFCDATLYVVRHAHTPKIVLKRLDSSLDINPLNNPGIVFNGVKNRGFFNSNHGYGYDYMYGKAYHNQSSKTKKT
jgi:tyrosine-protein kinase Etk/Wzc